MSGLLEKDLRLTLNKKQTLLIFAILAVFMGMSMDGAFLIGYLTMLAAILAVGTISYDEYDNGFAFLMTLPVDRRTYVREKYLFGLLMAAAAWCIGLTLYVIISFFRHIPTELPGVLPMLLALLPVMYLSVSLMIPLQLKYGAEKSRIAMAAVFGVIAIVAVVGGKLLDGPDNPLARLADTLNRMPPFFVLLVIVIVCALAALVSCLCSIRIMEKKEF